MMTHYQTPLTTEGGEVERTVPWDRWWIPTSIELQDDRLRWDLGSGKWVHAGRGLLDRFLRLGDADATGVLRYTQRWGVLGICEHGLPSSHNAGPIPRPIGLMGSLDRLPWCRPRGFWEGVPWETLEDWIGYAHKFRAIVNIATDLTNGEHAAAADWQSLLVAPGAQWSIADDRNQLAVVLTQLVGQAGVRPSFAWNSGGPTIGFTGSGLFAALTMQLFLSCAGSEGLALCSGCGIPYSPKRWPRAGERHYCDKCVRDGIPVRDAARDYRERARQKGSVKKGRFRMRRLRTEGKAK